MTPTEIVTIVKLATQVNVTDMKGKSSTYETHARYVAIMMMHEEGLIAASIARILGVARSLPVTSLKRINQLLTPKREDDASIYFKEIYLTCIKKMADMEDKAA